jgi:hypothetical protein
MEASGASGAEDKHEHIVPSLNGSGRTGDAGGVGAIATHLRHKNLQTASRYIDRRGAGSRALNALER